MTEFRFSKLVLLLIFALLICSANLAAQSDQDTQNESAISHQEEEAAEAQQTVQAEPETQKPPGFLDFLLIPKYGIFLVLMLIGLVLLFIKKINAWVRFGMMAVAFVLYGIDVFIPLHPSPMCAVTKLFMFKFTMGQWFPVFLALFLAIMVPSLIGRKFFCGWVCPLGAFQELINKIPHKFKWKNFNFTAFNSVRMFMFIMFFLTFFLIKDQISYLAERVGGDPAGMPWVGYLAYSIYEPINFFELLHWDMATNYVIMLILLVGSSLVIYRPFCYLICPIGAITWLLEKIAPGRVRVDLNKCIQCGECEAHSPCPTIKKLLDEKTRVLPDCTSCGECLGYCEEDAIHFGFMKK